MGTSLRGEAYFFTLDSLYGDALVECLFFCMDLYADYSQKATKLGFFVTTYFIEGD
jgi:hypothetical protein